MMSFSLNKLPSQGRDSRFKLPIFERGATISRNIFQTDRSTPENELIKRSVASIVDMNPGWTYRFILNSESAAYIERHYGEGVARQYERISPDYGAARADLFRYLLLYREGGVYLDMKSTMTRPLNEVLLPSDTYVLSRWRNAPGQPFEGWGAHREVRHLGGEFQQWFLACAPGHPFLRTVINIVLDNIDGYIEGLHGTGAYAVLRVTGPVPYTLGVSSLLARYDHRIVDSSSDLGFVYSVFDKGAELTHMKSDRRHYTKLTTPLVPMSTPRQLLSSAIRSGKTIVKALRGSKRPEGGIKRA